jgi:large conductance mechanosensitive channel
VVTYGNFLQALINFTIVSLSIFIVFKLLVTARKRVFERDKEEEVPPHEKSEDVRLLEEIRDILKGNAKETGI